MVRNASRSAAGSVDAVSSERGAALRAGIRSVRRVAIQHRRTVTSGIPQLRSAGVLTITAAGLRYRPYGWTWVGVGPWAWPTHHYGRWGILGWFMVLDSGTQLGAGMGVVGVCAGLRELVSARLEQSRRAVVRIQLRLRSLARLDGGAVRPLRSRIRSRQLRRRTCIRRAHACGICAALQRPGIAGVRGASLLDTHLRRRNGAAARTGLDRLHESRPRRVAGGPGRETGNRGAAEKRSGGNAIGWC